jgi:TolB-like protein/class 3 adenylate cyclase/Flp pilus assembly protein TadD
MSATRRLAAIMAIDVVGYSRLMGEDEAGTARAVKEHRDAARPILAALGGRIVKTMGDGLLLEFPSVVAAVEGAIAIQKLMAERNADTPEAKRIVYRIGVNLGDVLIEGDDIIGDGVNIAARIEALCEPGGVLISGAAYEHTRGRIDAHFVDLGEKALKNIERPIRVYSLQVGVPAQAKPLTEAKAAELKRRSLLARLALGLAASVVLIAAGAWYFLGANRATQVTTTAPAPVASNAAPAEPAHLSIVVLPFANLSGDPAQDYFADGITENLTTDLARIRDSFVIARNTAFTFKGKSIDAKEIGKQLGVRYVLEGSVQRDQNRVRVNAQLIDAETGSHLWADRFEEDVADLFKLQDQVVARLANTLGIELIKAEAKRDERIAYPDAFDLTMRGRALQMRAQEQRTKENNKAARAMFEQALAIDPNDAEALAGEATTYLFDKIFGWADPDVDYDAKVVGLADRSITIAPEEARPYSTKSLYLTTVNHPDEGLRAADAGLAVNPNNALLHAARGLAEDFLGHFDQGISEVRQAMRLSPRDPNTGAWHNFASFAELGLGHFDAAIEEANKAIDAGYRVFQAYAQLTVAYALEGKLAEAKAALSEARRVNPKLTVKVMRELNPDFPWMSEGLRKAGLPEE